MLGDSCIYEEYSWIVGDYVYWYVYGHQDTLADLFKFDKNQYRNEVKRFLPIWAEYIKNHSDEYFSGAFFSNYEQTQELIEIMDKPFEYVKKCYKKDLDNMGESFSRYGFDYFKLQDDMRAAIAEPEWRQTATQLW